MKRKIIFLICIIPRLLFSQGYEYFNRNDSSEYLDLSEIISDSPEDIIFNISSEIQENIFTSPVNYLELLVQELTSWTSEDYLKIKSIHDWIIYNIQYDWSGYNSGAIQVVDPYITLRMKKAVCGGYANLFNFMARMAGFDSYFIRGHAITSQTSKYANERSGATKHAWNGIFINGFWYLIDTTWDSQIDKNGNVIYYNDYLYINPVKIIESHYPDAPGWLLLDEFYSFSDFKG